MGILEFPSHHNSYFGVRGNLKEGVFLEIVSIKEDALPSAPSISEMTQAGREVGADIVLPGIDLLENRANIPLGKVSK